MMLREKIRTLVKEPRKEGKRTRLDRVDQIWCSKTLKGRNETILPHDQRSKVPKDNKKKKRGSEST